MAIIKAFEVSYPKWVDMVWLWVHWIPIIWLQYLLFRLKSLEIYLNPAYNSPEIMTKKLLNLLIMQIICTVFLLIYTIYTFLWRYWPVDEWMGPE